MKNKIAALAVIISLFEAASVYANPVTRFEGNKVFVTASAEPGSSSIMYVFKSGAEPDDDSQVFAMRQAMADENGKVSFSFGIPEEKNSVSTDGEYTVYIKEAEGENKKAVFSFAPIEKREKIISELKAGRISDVLNNDENKFALEALGIDTELYAEMTDDKKSSVISEAEKIMKNAKDDSDYSTAVSFAIFLECLNSDTGDASDKFIKNLGLSFDDTGFAEITDDKLIEFITEYIYENRSYSSYEKLCESYNAANALYIINGSRYTAVRKAICDYAGILGIDLSDEYIDVDSKEKADKKIVEILKSNPAGSAEALLDAIKEGIKAGTKKNTGGGSSGGSSGGGGGSKVIPSTSNPLPGVSVTTPAEQENKVYFSDVADVKWAEEAIYGLAEKGIVSGDGDGKFYPHRPLTREEFVKMLITAANLHDKNAKCDFVDVENDKWYYTYIASAFENKTVNGVSEKEFGIGRTLSRQDMAVMCGRGIKGIKTLDIVRKYVPFADESRIKDYALENIKMMYEAGIINGVGDNYFEPEGTATRAQGAVIIYNLFK